MTILPDLSELVIEQVSLTTEVTITVRAASPAAPYPCCGAISKRIQSRYTRTVRDLPASGRPVHLVLQDKAAVLAGLTLPWSNGPLEGHVNRLKLLKRSIYGRAKLPLLRQRVLHSPSSREKRHLASSRTPGRHQPDSDRRAVANKEFTCASG